MSYIYWNIKTQSESEVLKLSKELPCSDIVSRLLINRGLNEPNRAKSFLNPTESSQHDPFLLTDMKNAVDRIISAVQNNEKIYIYGDYDVDGITSVSVLYLYLKNFTENISFYIPDRFSQGYGINEAALDMLFNDGCSLIITVDTGISAVKEIEYAEKIGMDVVVTDHHECQDILPKACAVVNPKRHDSGYPFSKLAGVGVVYKLITALDIELGTDYHTGYIDLVAIGTVADIMPLLDENRYIVKCGLEKISKSPNLGLKALIDLSINSTNITATSIGFAIAPRINAAGRMAEAKIGVELFTATDTSKAAEIAKALCELNVERQKIETEIFEEACRIIYEHDLDRKYNALVLWKEGWHNGVIGIVASKLKEKFNKPVVLFSVDKQSKGSGRSVVPFNLYAAFEKCSDLLVQFGGHKYAAGLLAENDRLYEFRDRLSELVGEFTKEHKLSDDIEIECTVDGKKISYQLAEEIALLQPYGKSNDVPYFCIRNIRIGEVFPTNNNKHLRIKFIAGDKQIVGFYFGINSLNFDFRDGDLVDVVCEINANEYRNIKSAQLIIKDIRLNENQLSANKSKRSFCDSSSVLLKMMLPNKNDIGYVYKYLKKCYEKGRNRFNLDTLPNLINKDCLASLSYEQAYFSVKVLFELGVISGSIDDIFIVIDEIAYDKRFSLADSELLLSIYNKVGVKFGD